jgi:putative endonuclease
MKQPAAYIITNKKNGTLYTGVTSNLIARIAQHRDKQLGGFTARYSLKSLVWWEFHETMESAIQREKQLKGGSRAAKIKLIMTKNPDWANL